jgi:hypothetical protein
VISFDTDGYWVLDMQPVLDRLYLQAQVGTLSAGGGTDILAGMRLAGEAMQNETSDRKHIILLTDGGADPGGLVELTQSLNTDYGVTTSVISIGESTVGFLRQMADVGGGNYHEVMAVETIPQIFAQETVLATRSYIIEGEFNPVLSAISPIMEGISEAPSLLGYVATTPKDTAQVILSGPEPFSDPVLAAWQYGLGRAVAYTSDVSGRWSGNWVSWEGFARFWSQTVRWTITEGTDQNLESRIVMEGERARLTVDARADDGSFLNGLNLIGSLVYPDRSAVGLQLEQVAPGRYEATFTPGAEGAYFVRVSEADGVLNQTGGWVMSYSPEYSTRSDAESILPDLAELTSGTRQPLDNAAQAFAHTLQAQVATNPLAPTLLLIAVLLLPFDIAVRRLIITQSDLARLRRWLSPPEVVPDATERVSALMGAKARAQEKTSVTATQVTPTGEPTAGGETPAPQKIKVAPNAPPPIRGAPTLKESDEGNIAGKLLQKRKDRGGGS